MPAEAFDIVPVAASTDCVSDLEASPDEIASGRGRAVLDAHGVLIVRDLLVKDTLFSSYRDDLLHLIGAFMQAQKVPAGGESLDDQFNALCAHSRDLGGRFYEVARTLDSYYPLMNHPRVLNVATALLGAKHIYAPFPLSLVRIDRPHEPWFRLDWHQDYPYNIMGELTLTTWAPLFDVTAEMGPLHVIPGSHRHISAYDLAPRPARGGGVSKSFKIQVADHSVTDMEAKALAPEVRAGDVVFLHQLTQHRSGVNTSDRARWIVNHRYSDAEDPILLERGWRIGHSHDLAMFRELHPDRFRILDAPQVAAE